MRCYTTLFIFSRGLNLQGYIFIYHKYSMQPIHICVVGTHQTGSTRLFNLVRLIYEKKGKTVYSKWSISSEEIQELNSKYDIILCKIHDTDFEYLDNYHIKLLPIRNILDAAISAECRFNTSRENITEFIINNCNQNINIFNKFKEKSDFIFRYDNYNVHYIKKLCFVLNIILDNDDIIDIMKKLENMLNSKDIVKIDDNTDTEYTITLLSQHHNTSNGKTKKFITLSNEQLNDILKEPNILTFLEENLYF